MPGILDARFLRKVRSGEGPPCDFQNQRFIHSREEMVKGFEQMLIDKVKPIITKNVSKFQIGGIPGHQPAEHLFHSEINSRALPAYPQCNSYCNLL